MRPSPLLTTPSNALSPRLLMFSMVLQYTERRRDPTTQYEKVIFNGGWDFHDAAVCGSLLQVTLHPRSFSLLAEPRLRQTDICS